MLDRISESNYQTSEIYQQTSLPTRTSGRFFSEKINLAFGALPKARDIFAVRIHNQNGYHNAETQQQMGRMFGLKSRNEHEQRKANGRRHGTQRNVFGNN